MVNGKIPVDEIVSIPKGSRPDPSTYLSEEYIKQHLKRFENGGSFVMTRDQYEWFVEENNFIGFSDNTQFIAPKDFMDEIEQMANGDIAIYEKMLGFDSGYFQNGGGLVRFDATNFKNLNLRIPSGNEEGANLHWIPGGFTDGGTPEAVINRIPNNENYIKITFIN